MQANKSCDGWALALPAGLLILTVTLKQWGLEEEVGGGDDREAQCSGAPKVAGLSGFKGQGPGYKSYLQRPSTA